MIQALIGRKLGMTRLFDENGVVTASTLVQAGPCFVTQLKTPERDGYLAVQLGFGEKPRPNSPEKGDLKAAGLDQKTGLGALREVPADSLNDVELGAKVDASMFTAGEIVDVIGTSKGRGFAGVMKRHNFHGGPKTHGQSDRWRHSGSVGSGTTPGRTFKNMRMAGHLGDARVTVKNLRILSVDPERNLVVLRGAIPGPKGALVVIRKKPYRQKGTGYARQGSRRAPHYKGGGIVFGPHPRSYEKALPRKMRRLALRSALSSRAAESALTVVDAFD